jgi:hypothetical protein
MREIAGIVSACVCLSQVWARAKEEYDHLGGVRLSTEKKICGGDVLLENKSDIPSNITADDLKKILNKVEKIEQ